MAQLPTWSNLTAPGDLYRLVSLLDGNSPADAPMRRILAAYSILAAVVQPLAVDFEMAARLVDQPFLELDMVVPHPTWHVAEAHVPAHVEVEARFRQAGHQDIVVETLTPDEMHHWLTTAHQQPLVPGYRTTLYVLEMHYTRACIFDPALSQAILAYGTESYQVPIEQRPDGRWVAGPLRQTMTNPPIKVEFSNNDGRLRLDLWVGWSPWRASGTAEHTALMESLHAVAAQGWTTENFRL